MDQRILTVRHFSVVLDLMRLSFMALRGAFILLAICLREARGLHGHLSNGPV
ncbi:hypothetical protein [Streptomyces sp. NPDC013171]|uniref:hypothetical protein n=1 Tax=Streptomyces sp. NPDC013171 TaxID=3364863 RepID=UPI0036C101D9